jgi:two-component system nitrate/nitrite response regulator NarP
MGFALNRTTTPHRMMILADHMILAESIALLLEGSQRFSVKITSDLNDALAALAGDEIDLLLFDWQMQGMAGMSDVAKVMDLATDAKVAVLSEKLEAPTLQALLGAGVTGIIEKDMSLSALDSVLELILSGQSFVPVRTATTVATSAGKRSLNDIELSVLTRAGDGQKNKEIAGNLGLSEVSIKMHMRNICGKLGAKNRAHAAVISRELGLI